MAGNRQTAWRTTDGRPQTPDIHAPLDATVILLGMLLAGAIFLQGNFEEPRWLWNGWTWLATTAVSVILFLVASRWISRFWVRRSMQFALLFSLSAHLLLLWAATELWVPSKPWTRAEVREVEAVTRERQRTTRPDYFRHQFQQAAAQPDFLRPVEAVLPEPTDQDVPRSEAAEWTPPDLQVEMEWEPDPITSPSSLRRPELSETTPRQTEDARRISRQMATREVPLEPETIRVDVQVPDDSSDEPSLSASPSAEAARSARELVLPSAPQPENRDVEESLLQERLAESAMRFADRRRSTSTDDSPPLPSDPVVSSALPRRDVGRQSPTTTVAESLPQAGSRSSRSDESENVAARSPIQPSQATLARQPDNRSMAPISQPREPQATTALTSPSAASAPLARRPSPARARPPALGPADMEPTRASPRPSSARNTPSPSIDTLANVARPTRGDGDREEVESSSSAGPSAAERGTGGGAAALGELPDAARLTARGDRSGPEIGPRATSGPRLDEQLATLDNAAGRRRAESLPRRSSGRTAADVEAAEGAGGIAERDGREAGMTGRRTDLEAPLVDSRPARFPRREVGAPPPMVHAPVAAAEAFRQRIDRIAGAGDGEPVSPRLERAIELGLIYLARNQAEDGRWTLLGEGEERPIMQADSAATALALLAFQGAGYTHQQDRYAEVVRRGLRYLLSTQQPDGCLYEDADDTNSNMYARLYSHGIAALALCEAYGMTQDPELQRPAQQAVNFIVRSQHRELGGWRYVPNIGSDTSVTGWMMMALKSGELAGLDVPRASYEGVRRWLDRSQASENARHLYRYNPLAADTDTQRHGREPSATMTAVGLLLRLYVGWNRQHPGMQRGADYLLANLPALGAPDEPEISRQRDTYYWYYATQVMFHMGGEPWRAWQERLHPLLVDSQEQEGELAGSWDPLHPVPDRWAPHAGRLYVTTMNLLSLEVAYRHLPLYIDTSR
jgi:hypothetical protein